MDNFIETLSITLSLVALFLIPFILFISISLIKRHGFYIKANCWFCDTWTKVLYKERNSFNCPSCLQYNGFDQDGSYNKVIEAQHNISNLKDKKNTSKTLSASNGLCRYCNNNQQLKVYQLANFVPLNENNYDMEIEHFEKQLDKAYKLCKKCDTVLKSTLNKQHAWLFGNRVKKFA
ncbi:hypothetical protein NQ317_016022 [Molorchus minor]|uniref:Ima1 N-terminal domain-containing protein n=1 Tax=Molorchus minor TaxID=1323400 RepID=A0ABQ9JSG8_9CUCU|nr:hypothetical protein NQ317_016022 [Molorchus minor]